MKYLFTSIAFLFLIQTGFAQYTDVINSKRPGFSDSPFSVGTKVYQVESGLFYKNLGNLLYWEFPAAGGDPIEHRYSSKSFGTDITLRTGQFFEQLEFNLDLALQNENREIYAPEEKTESRLGFSKLTIGAKYLVYKPEYTDKSKEIHSWKARHSFDKRRLLPAVGVYAGLNTNLLDEMHKNPDGISARFAIYTQNDLSNRWIVLMNFIMDNTFTDYSENSFIGTTTYALTEKWSVFGEGQLFFRKTTPNDIQFGAGGAYLVNNNLQADLSFRMIFDERGDNTYLIGGGLSWRLDRHKDKIIKSKTDNSEPKTKEKKGFFTMITFGLFAKDKATTSGSTKMRTVKTSKAKSRNLTPPVNKKAKRARNKQNKRLIKEQKKRDKAMIKYNKKQGKARD